MASFSVFASRLVESVSALVIEIVAAAVVFGAYELVREDKRTTPLLIVLVAAAVYVSIVSVRSWLRIFDTKANEMNRKAHG